LGKTVLKGDVLNMSKQAKEDLLAAKLMYDSNYINQQIIEHITRYFMQLKNK